MNGLKIILINIIRTYKHEGVRGLEVRLERFQSDPYSKQMTIARYGELSARFLSGLIAFAIFLFRIKKWWFTNKLRKQFSDWVAGYFRAKAGSSRNFSKDHIRVQIDRPQYGFIKVVKGSYIISGWAVDLNTHSAAKVRIVVGDTVYPVHKKQREDVQQMFSSESKLSLDTGFISIFDLSVGVHQIRIEVDIDDSWTLVRWVLLLCMPKIEFAQQANSSYRAWARLEQKHLRDEIFDIKRHIDVMLHKPEFTVIIDIRQGIVGLENTLASLRQQIYLNFDLRILKDPSMKTVHSLVDEEKPLKDTTLSDIRGDFIVFLWSGQCLASNALYEFASAINRDPDIDLFYGDQDCVTESGDRYDPFYKPDWSPDYLETFNYIGFTACFRTSIAQGIFDKAHMYDFVLRFTERTTQIRHIGKILGHNIQRGDKVESTSAGAVAQDVEALSERLKRTDRCGTVCEHELHKGCYDIKLSLKHFPLVSVIIPTAGKTITAGERQVDLIRNVVGQIREKSTYKNIEIIVVDNGDLSATQVHMLTEAKCRLITYSDPVFNVSKKLNLGVSIARGEFLLLVNDDIEILTPSWIERLLEHFEKPHVGVVGAKLLYPNEKTQHVGIVHSRGNPEHVRRFFPRNEAGYYYSTCGVRNYIAVTGACMMVRTSIYKEVGGYSHELAITYNDIDFCLKVRQKGFFAVYVPSAELIHMESQSREAPSDTEEVAWYHQRWAAETITDKYYNEHYLTVAPPTFVPSINQRML